MCVCMCVCVCVCVCVCARVCLCSSTCWFLPAARHLWYTWEVRINDLLLWAFSGCFCQFPSSLSPNLSYSTSKNENSSRSPTGEKAIWYNVLREKMIYIDIGYKSVRLKTTSYDKILKIRGYSNLNSSTLNQVLVADVIYYQWKSAFCCQWSWNISMVIYWQTSCLCQ